MHPSFYLPMTENSGIPPQPTSKYTAIPLPLMPKHSLHLQPNITSPTPLPTFKCPGTNTFPTSVSTQPTICPHPNTQATHYPPINIQASNYLCTIIHVTHHHLMQLTIHSHLATPSLPTSKHEDVPSSAHIQMSIKPIIYASLPSRQPTIHLRINTEPNHHNL